MAVQDPEGSGILFAGIGNLVSGVLSNVPGVVGAFSDDYRDDQIALAQAQGDSAANLLALQQANNQRTQPNYTLYIIIAIVVIVAIYLFTRKKS